MARLTTDAQAFEARKAEAARLENIPTLGTEPRLRASWEAHQRADVTLSLADPAASQKAAEAVSRVLDTRGAGYTLREGIGGWRGSRESAYTFTLVGQDVLTVARAATQAAIHIGGCTAVQIETWDTRGYTVQEWEES
jgi:hypothetical protein